MSLKENVSYVKDEISSEEKFLEGDTRNYRKKIKLNKIGDDIELECENIEWKDFLEQINQIFTK